MNDFSESHIPSEIARLKQLRILDLSTCSFSGQIPNEISLLVKLIELDLSWNPLKLQDFSLEYMLQNMTRLELLHLSDVDIISSVPRFLANFSSLRSIHLEDCQLRDEFPPAIFHLPKLKSLSLTNNPKLTGSFPEFRNNTILEFLSLYSTGFAGIIPGSISKLNRLELLSLSGCHFSGLIPGSLSNLTQLTWLDLENNNLRGEVPSLESLSKLVFLALSNSNFENGRFPNWLSKLTRLNKLYLDRMSISDEIPPSLPNLTRLTAVTMGWNFIGGCIPSSFMNLTQLTTIDFQQNELQGPISSAFSDFKSLEALHLGFNNFSGSVDLDTFVGLDKLHILILDKNRLSCEATDNYVNGTIPQLKYLGLASCNLKEFPAFLRFQRKLEGLFLYDNKIEGLVPVWIWNNSQETMQTIGLSHNFITGFQQHPHFLPWVCLEFLDLSYNHLRGRLPIPSHTIIYYDASNNNVMGEIPPLICELKSIRVLDLSCNNMTGTLPLCFGKLSHSLLDLDLKRNNFHGPMMNTFTRGSSLKRIDLSENRLMGQVARSLMNCTNLEVLSLGDNSIDDIFPFWLGNLSSLQVLILRSNKFHGAIQGPTGNSQFSKLRIIDLSNNGLSGQLPGKYFQSWNAMKSFSGGKTFAMNSDMNFDFMTIHSPYSVTLTNKGVKTEFPRILNIFIAMDLSCNNLEGQIPQSLQDLQGLQSLNLSNNHLTGRILPSLGNLKNLESLDLSQNELSREVPQELLQLGFLAILNVSFNHLNGSIPQGKQFNTFDNSSYMGNPGLCGKPLSNECDHPKAPILQPTSNESESHLPSDIINWIVIFTGFASGLAIGIVVGNILYGRYSDWFIDRFGMRKDIWIRPLRNTRRS